MCLEIRKFVVKIDHCPAELATQLQVAMVPWGWACSVPRDGHGAPRGCGEPCGIVVTKYSCDPQHSPLSPES